MRPFLVLGLAVLAAAPLEAQRRSDVVRAEEIARVSGKGGTAFTVVQTLRPRWLRARELFMQGDGSGVVRTAGPHVYLNDVDQGDVDYLKTIPAELVSELRWLSANQAASRFGPTNGPAIVVTLKL
jgi:hypothetical protein